MSEFYFPRLVAEDGDVFILDAPVINLGRAPDNQVVLKTERSSRHHAVITFVNGRCHLRDLDSKNGTYLNGVLIKATHLLANGDHITIGGISFIFEDLMPTQTDTMLPDKTVPIRSRVIPDPDRLQVTIEREPSRKTYTLNANQWKVFWLLYQKAGAIVSRDELYAALYPTDPPNLNVYDTSIEVLVSRLRKALEIENEKQAPYIRAVRGVGYRLEV
jgi:pSer/pThr/pTyr-binding forkhead associated (FHA) protein